MFITTKPNRLNTGASAFSAQRPASSRGTTLIEMMVAMTAGTCVLGSILTTGITLTNTMMAIGNYCDLNRSSRHTLDVMSADLRNTAIVTAASSKQVTVSNTLTADIVSYTWDGSNKVTRVFNQMPTVMLVNCDFLCFSNYQRNPTANFEFLPASTPGNTKLISVSWRCSRQILGAKINTESVQTAKICIRN